MRSEMIARDAICARRCARVGDPPCWDIGLPPEIGGDGSCGGVESITCKAVAERYVRILTSEGDEG